LFALCYGGVSKALSERIKKERFIFDKQCGKILIWLRLPYIDVRGRQKAWQLMARKYAQEDENFVIPMQRLFFAWIFQIGGVSLPIRLKSGMFK